MRVEEILEAKFETIKDDITSLIYDVEKGFESAQLSMMHLEIEDGKIIEVQVIVTSNEDDFIDEPQP